MSVGGIGGWIAAPTGGRSARSTPPRTLGSPCIISSPLGAVQARSASFGGLSACPELTTRPFATREPAPPGGHGLFLFFLSIPRCVNAPDCCGAAEGFAGMAAMPRKRWRAKARAGKVGGIPDDFPRRHRVERGAAAGRRSQPRRPVQDGGGGAD